MKLRSRLVNRRTQFVLDFFVLVLAFLLAYLLRFDFEIPPRQIYQLMIQLPYVVLIQLCALIWAGGYGFVWRYIGMMELKTFIKAAGLSVVPPVMIRAALPQQFHEWQVPFSIIIFDTLLAFSGVLGLRVLRRAHYERFEKRRRTESGKSKAQKSVLLVGAGQAGQLTAKEIINRGDTGLTIKGFVDDDPAKQRTVIQGVKVVGKTEDLPRLVNGLKIDQIVISMAQAPRRDLRRILEICEKIPIKVQIIPGLYEILQGDVEVSRIRDVRIEDLLGREPVNLDEESLQLFLEGKTVMVTGAGGSIGSELARQVLRFQPLSLLLVERAENALFNIDRELRAHYPAQKIVSLIADIGDETRVRAIFETHHPQVVLHAAAHKHVPLMEFNSQEALKNNVFATRLLGEVAGEFATEVFVLISTDKAVCPTSVMGATKRLAELLIQDLNCRMRTRYVAVRFGNVIGSAGSVIPIFREQIMNGGPVTVTDRRMTRYFMTLAEASQLVLQVGAMGKSGNGGEVFVLQMGEPIRIVELAETLINLSGLKPHEDIKIVETGIRPGEKLKEELLMTEENVSETAHPKIFINKIAEHSADDLRVALERLEIFSRNGHERELRLFLNEFLPNANLDLTPQVSGIDDNHATRKEKALSAAAGDSTVL